MGTKRTIFCSDCGARLVVPAAARPGRKVRCGKCKHVFIIPVPIAATIPKRPSAVDSYDIQDLPDNLQATIRRHRPSDDKKPKFPTITDPGALLAPHALTDQAGAERKAFDLDRANAPRRMTGAGVIDISHMDLSPAWLGENKKPSTKEKPPPPEDDS